MQMKGKSHGKIKKKNVRKQEKSWLEKNQIWVEVLENWIRFKQMKDEKLDLSHKKNENKKIDFIKQYERL